MDGHQNDDLRTLCRLARERVKRSYRELDELRRLIAVIEDAVREADTLEDTANGDKHTHNEAGGRTETAAAGHVG